MSVLGMSGPAAPAGMPGAMTKPTITHIEIRRVQNGFVVAGINMDVFESTHYGHMPQRATFIAKDVAELASLLEWIATGSELKWLPTVDLPVWDMQQREQMRQQNQAQPTPGHIMQINTQDPNNPPPSGEVPLGSLMVKVP